MYKIFIIFFVYLVFGISFLHAYTSQARYAHSTALYMNLVTQSISQQLVKNQKIILKKEYILLHEIVNSDDYTTQTELTHRLDENLLYGMSIVGFKVLDTHLLHDVLSKKEPQYILIAIYTRYKNEIIINCRIVSKKTAVIVSVAQVSIPKRIEREIERLYKK